LEVVVTEREIFDAVCKLPPHRREQYLLQACNDDEVLKQRIRKLLQAYEQINATRSSNVEAAEKTSSDSRAIANPATEMQPTAILDAEEADPLSALVSQDDLLESGNQIGPYKLLQVIGHGGMGAVWIAEQSAPVKRRVALKVIKDGIGSKEILARFESEQQALSMMNHPNIARFLDSGTTATGQPFFAMELVLGKPLTAYCDENRLSIDQRLNLFIDVCNGVQHAHQKGIIHRDLKPGNILVTVIEGKAVAKVIDFGLAKAMESTYRLTEQSLFTGIGQILGTMKYMSPEQASLDSIDIDTRTDIYALGIILYELLTGSTPLDDSSIKGHAALKVLEFIRNKEPIKPSSKLSNCTDKQISTIIGQRKTDSGRLNRILSGDLDWIVMKALEKDRTRRYESASGFAEDVLRYLHNEPVVARSPSLNYRISKFVRKNRAGVIAAGLLALSLLGGLLGTSWGLYLARQSAEAERIAKNDAQKSEAEAIAQRHRAQSREQQAIDAVERFGESISNNPELKNNPSLESLRKTLLREPISFFQSLRTQLEADGSTTPESMSRLASVAFSLGHLTEEIGSKEDALQAYQQAMEILRQLVVEHPQVTEFQNDLANSQISIGSLLKGTGKLDEALQAYEQAQEIQQRLVRENPTLAKFQNQLAGCHYNIGHLLRIVGKIDEALREYEQALEMQRRLVRENPSNIQFQSDLGKSYNNIGSLLSDTGKPTEALKAYEQALEIRQRLVRENPTISEFLSYLAATHENIGRAERRIGRFDMALQAYELALNMRRRLATENPTVTQFLRDLASSHNNFGSLLNATGKPTEALQEYQQALGIFESLVRKNPGEIQFQSHLARCHSNIGSLLRDMGKPNEALQAYEHVLDIRRHLVRENPTVIAYLRDLSSSFNNIGILLSDMGKPTEALQAYEQAREIQQRLVRENPTTAGFQIYLVKCYINIAKLLIETGKPTEASQAFAEALEVQKRLADENPSESEFQSEVGSILNNIAVLDINAGRWAEACKKLRQAIEFQERAFNSNANDPVCREFLMNHLQNLRKVALQLDDVMLARQAQRRMAELAWSDPKNAALQGRLIAVDSGEVKADPKEMLTLAQFGYKTMRFAAATRLFTAAFEQLPNLAEDRENHAVYMAACCAAMASIGEGLNEPKPDKAGQTKLRADALAWLNAELKRWEKFATDDSIQAEAMRQTLMDWLKDPDLNSVRDVDHLKGHSEAERGEWQNLWQRVREKK
jgi:eukaryotic-like serine/threonine-protein kinase